MQGALLSIRANLLKQRLLEKHSKEPFLESYELKAMSAFKATYQWATKFARQAGWRSIALHGEAGDVDKDAVFDSILNICHKLGEFDQDYIYNMDETGLNFKLLPDRSYVPKKGAKSARGTKFMKSKDRVTLFVCTNASGTDKVPLCKYITIHFQI